MHITSGVLLESKLQEELQEQERRKVSKYLQIQSSKEAIHKSKERKLGKTEEKKKDKKRKNGGRKHKSPKKPQTESNKADNRYVNRYTNYTSLNAAVDHIFAVTRDKSIFGKPNIIRQNRSKRDARKFYRFHNDRGMTRVSATR